MLRKLSAVLVLLALLCTISVASAERSLRFRTGPGYSYGELFTLPITDDMSNKGIDIVDGVEWVLVEFTHEGKLQRAYAEVGDLDISRDAPSPSVDCLSCFMNGDTTVYAAPSRNAAVRGTVQRLRMINYLATVTGDDGKFYDFIEFYDKASLSLSRGYIPSDAASYTSDPGAYMTRDSAVYGAPTYLSNEVGEVGYLEIVGYVEQENGFARIQFYSAAKADRVFGYVPIDIVKSPYID